MADARPHQPPAGFTPKVVVKRRKPRSSAVVEAANDRLRADGPRIPKAAGLKQAAVRAKKESQTGKEPKFAPGATSLPPSAAPVPEETTKRKGLRHFAVRVSKKVEQKQFTSYNEVADELVIEEKNLKQAEVDRGGKLAPSLQRKIAKGGALVDEKNIRRRVYDSLNVLMAMGIIEKNRKVIQWRGIAMARASSERAEIARLRAALVERQKTLERKRAFCRTVEEQAEQLGHLVARNSRAATRDNGVEQLFPAAAQVVPIHQLYPDRIGMPFLLVGTSTDTKIGLEIDRACEDVAFTFSAGFTIYDDREILRRMQVAHAEPEAEGAGVGPEGQALLDAVSRPASPMENLIRQDPTVDLNMANGFEEGSFAYEAASGGELGK